MLSNGSEASAAHYLTRWHDVFRGSGVFRGYIGNRSYYDILQDMRQSGNAKGRKGDGRDAWSEEELRAYDGTDETGPILMAVKGDVYNVWKGRNFYGPGAEYHIINLTNEVKPTYSVDLIRQKMLKPVKYVGPKR